MKNDVYQIITNHILEMMDHSTGKWKMPWHNATIQPVNVETGKPYHGINVLSLWCASLKKGYTTGYWGTFKQWKTKGASVRKGEKACPVVFYKPLEREETNPKTGETELVETYVARLYWAFNADQVEGWQAPALPSTGEAETVHAAERFVTYSKARIVHQGGSAFYCPSKDAITMPPREWFFATHTSSATENYYSALFHELTHWTGHQNRLDRNLTTRFGKESRAMEELVAELGAAFLCVQLGISPTPREDHAAYLAGWLQALKNDKRAIFAAASKASQAVDYLNGLQPENQQVAA